MCTIIVAPETSTTTRFADAACYQDFNGKRAERTEDRKRQLTMKWVVVTDELGNRRIEMRWTFARPSISSTLHKQTPQYIQPAIGRVCDPPPARRYQL